MKRFKNTKTATELGLYVGQYFTVVEGDSNFKKGTTVRLVNDDNTRCPLFQEVGNEGNEQYFWWHDLTHHNKRTPRKHAKLIRAWADGAEIEYLCSNGEWILRDNPQWRECCEYRVKPEKTEVEIERDAISAEMAKLKERLDNLPVT